MSQHVEDPDLERTNTSPINKRLEGEVVRTHGDLSVLDRRHRNVDGTESRTVPRDLTSRSLINNFPY